MMLLRTKSLPAGNNLRTRQATLVRPKLLRIIVTDTLSPGFVQSAVWALAYLTSPPTPSCIVISECKLFVETISLICLRGMHSFPWTVLDVAPTRPTDENLKIWKDQQLWLFTSYKSLIIHL